MAGDSLVDNNDSFVRLFLAIQTQAEGDLAVTNNAMRLRPVGTNAQYGILMLASFTILR